MAQAIASKVLAQFPVIAVRVLSEKTPTADTWFGHQECRRGNISGKGVNNYEGS